MNASDIIGYAFDGAEYCLDCIDKKRRALNAACTCKRSERDENGLCQENCHGYGPNPVFADSECSGSCDTCGEALMEPWDEDEDGGGYDDPAETACGPEPMLDSGKIETRGDFGAYRTLEDARAAARELARDVRK